MEVSVLGSLLVQTADGMLRLDRPKERMVLAALAMEPGATVTTDRLVDALWRGASPRTAGKTLQNHVLRLRRVLGTDTIVTDATGYRLAITPDAVDATRFELVVRDAASAQGSAATTAKALSDALAEWRGDAYTDLSDWPPGDVEARRLNELRLIAEELKSEADINCGRHALASIELEALLKAQPLRERRWQLVMLALYRDGRQSDALRAFARARTILADELGVAPGPGLVDIERAILRQDALLDPELSDFAHDAVNLRRRALADVDAADAVARAELLTDLGVAQRDAGDPNARDTLLEAADAAHAADAAQEAARAALALNRRGGMGAHGGHVDNPRVTALQRAIAGGELDPATRARALSSLATELTYVAPLAQRRELADEALELARGRNDPRLLADVLLRRVGALSSPDLLALRDRESRECLELADEVDDQVLLWGAACARSAVALQMDAPAECDRALSIAQRAIALFATPAMQYVVLVRLAARDLLAGRLVAAEREIEEAFALGLATGQPETIDVYSTQLLHLRHAQGRLDELRAAIAGLDLDRPHPFVRPFCAWIFAEFGDEEAARACLARAVTEAPALRDDELKLVALGYSAMAISVLKDRDAAHALMPMLEPYRDQRGNTGAFAMPRTSDLLKDLERYALQTRNV